MNPKATDTCLEIGKINFQGNITPHSWRKTVTTDSGRPDHCAIAVLSELVYWYRPKEVRTDTGVYFERKFRGHKLQVWYQQFADTLGLSKRQVQESVKRLKSLGVVTVEIGTLELNSGQKLGGIVFIELVPSRLVEITWPQSHTIPPSASVTPLPIHCDPPHSVLEPPSQSTVTPLTVDCDHTKTTYKDHYRDFYKENQEPPSIPPQAVGRPQGVSGQDSKTFKQTDIHREAQDSTRAAYTVEQEYVDPQKVYEVTLDNSDTLKSHSEPDPTSHSPEPPVQTVHEQKGSEAVTTKLSKFKLACQEVVEAYNRDKPESWAAMRVLNKNREKALKPFYEQLGDELVATVSAACWFAAQDKFWGTKAMTFDTLLRDNRLLAFAERTVAIQSSNKQANGDRIYEEIMSWQFIQDASDSPF